MKLQAMIMVLATCACLADPMEDRARFLMESNGVDPSVTLWAFTAPLDGSSARTGFRCESTNGWTLADVLAVDTNSATFAAWLLTRPEADDAAEIDSLEADLTNAVFQAFTILPPYSANAQANYKTLLRSQMNTARADVDAATTVSDVKTAQKKVNLLQQIINIVRELKGIKPSWALGDVE